MELSPSSWLSDVVILNENREYRAAGDVDVFRSLGDACRYLEPWYIEQEMFFTLNGLGQAIEFSVENNMVVGAVNGVSRPDADTLKVWLVTTAGHVFEARKHRSVKRGVFSTPVLLGEQESKGVLPQSVEGLIAYIGFTD